MPSLVVANSFSIIVLLIVIFGILGKHNRTRTSLALLAVCVMCIFCDLADALSYSIAGPLLPDYLTMTIYIASYTFGNLLLIFFTNYWYTYINEKHAINKIFAIIPISLLLIAFFTSLFYFLSGRVVKVENGVTTFVGSQPLFINIIQILVLIYFPMGAIIERKYIGIKAVSFLGAAGLVPIISIFLSLKFQIPDYSYPCASIAMMIAYILFDTQLTIEKDEYYLYQLVERNLELEKINLELEKSKKNAECANNAKTAFLNNMSHDIRTPMNAILGFTGLIEASLDDKEKVKDYIQKINTAGDYLLNIINNVLDIARIDSGKMVLDEDPNDLLSPDNTVIPMISGQIEEKHQTLIMTSDIKHRYVYVDMIKTKQIMLNLVSNAVKYTPEGGTITLRFEEKPCDKPGYGTYVTTVTDTGIGMSPEFVEHIFEAFAREYNTTESKVLGTGLGMAIVKMLVDIMGGTIEVESEVGKGSTFRVINTHKFADSPTEQVENSAKSKKDIEELKGKSILLAEDNDLNAEIAMTILEDCGFKIERAKDGIEAVGMLSKADSNYYDVILMDIQMPNMDGITATKKIRKMGEKEKSEIPIIAMTANAFDEDKRKVLEAGMNGFVPKPIDVPVLLAEINSLID